MVRNIPYFVNGLRGQSRKFKITDKHVQNPAQAGGTLWENSDTGPA